MGTQQLLLIVLGVIIVGIAIAVGITIFNNQSYNANQQAVSSELNTYGSMVLQWWKTPAAQGGAGKGGTAGTLVTGDSAKIATFIGLPSTTETGAYSVQTAADATTVVILKGKGNEKKGGVFPVVTTTINLLTDTITSVVSSEA